jgi:hypothetical protein
MTSPPQAMLTEAAPGEADGVGLAEGGGLLEGVGLVDPVGVAPGVARGDAPAAAGAALESFGGSFVAAGSGMANAATTMSTATTAMPSQTIVVARLRRGRRGGRPPELVVLPLMTLVLPSSDSRGPVYGRSCSTIEQPCLRIPSRMKLLRSLTYSKWKLLFAAGLVLLSGALYLLQWAVFDDGRSTLFYLLQDVAFLPISILVVAIIVAEAVAWRERESLIHKLNMVVGVFFSEAGNDLLRLLVAFDRAAGELSALLAMDENWPKTRFTAARQWLRDRPCACDARAGDLQALEELLRDRRQFLLQLVENQSLLEHQSFTELMWAVLHVNEELGARGDVAQLSEDDLDHLSGDIGRAYRILLREWLSYMQHLSADYPYLYSLAVRTSPLRGCATKSARELRQAAVCDGVDEVAGSAPAGGAPPGATEPVGAAAARVEGAQ